MGLRIRYLSNNIILGSFTFSPEYLGPKRPIQTIEWLISGSQINHMKCFFSWINKQAKIQDLLFYPLIFLSELMETMRSLEIFCWSITSKHLYFTGYHGINRYLYLSKEFLPQYVINIFQTVLSGLISITRMVECPRSVSSEMKISKNTMKTATEYSTETSICIIMNSQ